MIYRIDGQLHPDWALSLLFSKRYDAHYFLVWHPNTTVAAPSENPLLGTKDSAMIGKFVENLQDMNNIVATSAALARSAPPAAPGVSGARKFYRVKADWTVDTDGDGTEDWMEFAIASDPAHPNHTLASAFNPDTDGDGVQDGQQSDFDGDGVFNSNDASGGDKLINWPKGPHARYALFELNGAPPPSDSERGIPFHVTDRGSIPFREGIWSNNTYTSLTLSSVKVSGARVAAIGESGRILGFGAADFNEDETGETPVVVYWNDVSGEPEIVKQAAGGQGETFASANYAMGVGEADPGTLLDAQDNFFARKQSLTWDEPTDPPVPPKPFYLNNDSSNALWKLPSSGSTASTCTAAPPYATNLIDETTFWGIDDSQNPAQTLLTATGSTTPTGGASGRISITPSGSFIASAGYFGTNARITFDNGFVAAADLSRALDVSSAGWAILNTGQIWMNGKVLPFESAAPGLPSSWQGSTEFKDSSPAGNLLLRCDDKGGRGQARTYGLGIPFYLEDNEPATGIDSTSITSTNPGTAVGEKHWIMAPAGSTNAFTLCSTANPHSPLTLSAGTVGVYPSTISSNRQTISASAPLNTNSNDYNLQIRLNGQLSLTSPIGVKVMKNRTVNITVHKIGTPGQTSSGTPYVNGPDFVPTEAALAEYLNNVFHKQINTTIESEINPDVVPVDWDTGTSAQYGVEDETRIVPGDGKLMAQGGRTLSPELQNIYNSSADADADINVYLIGGVNLCSVSNSSLGLIVHPGLRGAAIRGDVNAVFIDADYLVGQGSVEKIQHTIAHEMGHIFFDFGHPDEKTGPAPLPGTKHEDRLMVSGGKLSQGVLTVKAEWDEAEKWLDVNIAN